MMNETPCPLVFVFRRGTRGAASVTDDRLRTQLRQAYHGIQCLACGTLLADRRPFQVRRQRRRGDRLAAMRVRGA